MSEAVEPFWTPRRATVGSILVLVVGAAVDFLSPADVNVGVVYIAAVLLTAAGRSTAIPLGEAALSMFLLLLAGHLGPAAAGGAGLGWLNRGLTAATLGVAAAVAWMMVRRTLSLELMRGELERRVEDRTLRLEAEVRARREIEVRLEHATRLEALGHMVADVSHDFRNLLTAVTGNLDLLRRKAGDRPDLIRQVAAAEAGVARAVAQAKRLLSFARKQERRPALVDVHDVLKEIEPILQHAVGRQVRLRTNASSGLMVNVEVPRLELALLNLCVNARDALPSGGDVVISARRISEDGGDHVTLCVEDNGSGMDEATLRRASEAFFSTKPDGRGTGLGLPMVKEFAVATGGAIDIQSSEGIGTRVSIVLPMAP